MDNRVNYINYLKGKRVAIVGPSPSILGSNQKDKLEAYDVIVRLNRALPIPLDLVDDIGLRTDVLYNCMNPGQEYGGSINIDLLHESGVKFLVSTNISKNNTEFAYINIRNDTPIAFCHVDNSLYNRVSRIFLGEDLSKDLPKEFPKEFPNTGMMAILDLLHQDIEELYITGFTFYKGGYIKQYRGYSEKQIMDRIAKLKTHDVPRQLSYMRKILRNNPRVVMDKALLDIINDNDKLPIKIDESLIEKHYSSIIIDILDAASVNVSVNASAAASVNTSAASINASAASINASAASVNASAASINASAAASADNTVDKKEKKEGKKAEKKADEKVNKADEKVNKADQRAEKTEKADKEAEKADKKVLKKIDKKIDKKVDKVVKKDKKVVKKDEKADKKTDRKVIKKIDKREVKKQVRHK